MAQPEPTEVHEKVAIALAHAGLVPFLALTVMSFMQWAPGFAVQAMLLYSLAILCFLGGTWWGFALLMSHLDAKGKVRILLLSNAIVLVAVGLMLLFSPVIAIYGLGALYVVIMYGERWTPGLDAQPPWYRAMRTRVSMIAAGSHLLFGWAISAI